ncbi:hypothetical protein PFISCL1PPCAC_25268, partial [Pristionchus fissidentatus]
STIKICALALAVIYVCFIWNSYQIQCMDGAKVVFNNLDNGTHSVAHSLNDMIAHIVDKESRSFLPQFLYPDRRLSEVELVIGIPTVRRQNASYLISTLSELFEKAYVEDLNKIRIVVMISENPDKHPLFMKNLISELRKNFQDRFDSQILQIFIPPKQWFPLDLDSMQPTLGDAPSRMFWRTKQSLDYAYLMSYSAKQGKYYLQLEDDIIAAKDYTNIILRIVKNPGWFLMELSNLGFIGKLIHSYDIPLLAVHILSHYKYKPVDWLLDDYLRTRFCRPDRDWNHCMQEIAKYRLKPNRSLFQHIGYFSSLPGKIQRLKDSAFSSDARKTR